MTRNELGREGGGCPVDHGSMKASNSGGNFLGGEGSSSASSGGGGCPVDHSKIPSTRSEAAGGGCPVDHSKMDPRNRLPVNLNQQPSTGQDRPLPTSRRESTIPKTGSDGTWVYPSPQMFYNAMQKKNKGPETDHMEEVVAIHNAVNEQGWKEVLRWEKFHMKKYGVPSLTKFAGKSTELSPKARFVEFLTGKAPFDRHDWIINRGGRPVRYIIDYYDGEDSEDTGMPVFFLDCRPALDSFVAVCDRIRMWVWGD
uniref:Holocytochrome c-type synthase n=1 Tax=Roombia sp. NY0200 TaxID=1263497 RepID=A0A1E1GHV4_9CRYP|nr:cytochrome c heme-lyase [Roombia sp. NY0200]